MKLKAGDRVKFVEEKQRYTVQACNERYAVCTKPFNPKHTVLYTIVDFEEQIRGTENLIFCAGFETQEQCEGALDRLMGNWKEGWATEISHRNRIPLRIEEVEGATP